ncbi:MAG: phosphoglucomutase/phosphomannomutase family protein [Chitinophagales bacterium]
MGTIKFGTDGWRDVIADNFTFANVRIVAQGMAHYLNNHSLAKRGVVLGYDHRFLSREFAEAVCCVMAGNGIKVFLPGAALPTPVVAYAVRARNAGGAVMITASHNPPEYNGLKFIPEYAGPALPEETTEIEHEVQRVAGGARIYELSLSEARKLNLIEELDIRDKYLEHIKTVVNTNILKEKNISVIVDPMYGAGTGYLESILGDTGCKVEVINDRRDPLFGGSMPEPTDHILMDLKKEVVKNGAILGLALDGDADRFGVVDNNGIFITPNRVLYLLLWHLLKTRDFRGPVARTLATTHMLDKVGSAYGLGVIETPVGFKYIGQCMRERGCILGGEESGGMTILGHVPEKDGILACLLVAEMAAHAEKPIPEIYQEFASRFGEVESDRLDVRYEAAERDKVMLSLKDYRPRQVNGLMVEKVSEMEGKKLLLENGSWALIRASGTEPLIRIYVEAENIEIIQAIQAEIRGAIGL